MTGTGRARPIVGLALAVVLATVACGGGDAPPAPAAPAPAGSGAPAVGAATVDEKPIEIGVVAVQPMGSNDLIVLADRLGFYRKHGLRATVTSASSTTVVQGLIAGSFDVASTSAETFINANLEGADLAIVGQINRALQLRLMAAPPITAPAQLKGTVGCTVSIGGGSYMSMRHYVLSQGLDPDNDLTLVATGSSANNEAALRAGKCQFTVASSDAVPRLVAEGMNVLHDFRGTPYPLAVVGTTRASMQADRERLLRFLRAITETIAYVQTHPAETMADLVARGVPDDDELRRAYEESAANLALPPTPDPEAYRNLIDWNAEYLPAYRGLVMDRHVEPDPMAELERSGFLRSFAVETAR
jgi:ABC-type nitrate/sulfonate/bicarbonate transport system substrate-binding protein